MRTYSVHVLFLLPWLLSAASGEITCAESGNPTACYPPYRADFAAGALPEASNTCGLAGPERVCYPLGSRGRVAGSCDFCDAADASLAHLPEHITDSEAVTYWQSQTLTFSDSVQYPSSVSVTLSFNRTLEIREIVATFHSSRPESYTILKSTDFGLTYTPFHYFSQSCNATYGVAEGTVVEVGNEAVPLCTSEAAQLVPSSGGQAIFRPLMHRPSAANFESVPELQKWVMATDIRLRLDRLNTFGDEILSNNPKILDSYYYAISNLEVDARCSCNGHASACVTGPGGQLECVCEHNTAGADCSECLPTHQAVPWAPATPDDPSVCRETPGSPVFLGSLTTNANNVQGNVFALGERTLMLTEFFYDGLAPAARFYVVRGPSVTSPDFRILLDETGSDAPLREYRNETVVLFLPPDVTVHSIDWFSVWEVAFTVSFGELQLPDNITIITPEPPVCDCDPRGTVGGSCRRNGTCPCKVNVESERCSQCREEFFALSRNNPDGCLPCDCDPIGSVSAQCNPLRGRCSCRPGFAGRRCDVCAAGSGGPDCQACSCDPIGSLGSACSRSGQCDCRPGVGGLSCDACLPGYFGFGPVGCRSCDCHPLGANDSQCDDLGQCACREGVEGEKCDMCPVGYSNLSDSGCVLCDCEGAGVRVGECEPSDGSCLCLPGYVSEAQGPGCVPCPCPGMTPEGQFASSCEGRGTGGGVVCLDCQEGHGGDQCETCLEGYFGDPDGTITGSPLSCIQCDCNGNVDPTDPDPCDTLGNCRSCSFNTAGRQCERCAPGYYGDATIARNCTACSCSSQGTAGSCDPQTGSCACLPGVVGPDCSQCAPGYFNMTAGEGCQPCRCNPVGTADPALQCNSMGACECREGTAGTKCDSCLLGYYWSEDEGCLPCNCHPNGSISEQCDNVGVCQCQDIAIGDKCDICRDGFHFLTEGCIPCPACYEQIATEFNETLALYEELLSLLNTSTGGLSPELLREIERYEELLLGLLQRLTNLTQREDMLRASVDSAVVETADLSELIGQFGTNVSAAESATAELRVLVDENLVLLEELRRLVAVLEQTLRLQIRWELQELQSLYSSLLDELNQLVNLSQLANETSFAQQTLAARLLQQSVLALRQSTTALDLLCQAIELQNETTTAIALLEEDTLPPLEDLFAAARAVLSRAESEVPAALSQARNVLERALGIVIPEYDVESLRVTIEVLANRTEVVFNATVVIDSELDNVMREYELLQRNATRLLDESRSLNAEAEDLLIRAHGALAFANDSVEEITELLNRVTSLLDELRLRLADAGNFTAAVEALLRNVELAENLSSRAGQEAEQRAMEVLQAVLLAGEAAGLLEEASRDIQEALAVATRANTLAVTTLSNATALNSSVHDLASQVGSTQATVEALERQADADSAAITNASSTAREAIAAGSEIQERIVELQANLSELSRELNASTLLSPERLQAVNATVISLEAEESESKRIVDGLQMQIEQLQASATELRSRYVQLQQHRDLLEDILSNVRNLDCENQFQRLNP